LQEKFSEKQSFFQYFSAFPKKNMKQPVFLLFPGLFSPFRPRLFAFSNESAMKAAICLL